MSYRDVDIDLRGISDYSSLAGIFPQGRQTPHALANFQKAEIDKWWPVIKSANIKPE